MTGEIKKQQRSRLMRFLAEDIWDIEVNSLSWLKRLGINAVKVANLVVKGFMENKCPIHASALTYTTLISFVPILAMALAILRGLGAGELAEKEILSSITAMPVDFQDFVKEMLGYVRNTDFKALGGVGMLFLILIVVQMLSQVEMAFNLVWGAPVSRNVLRKFADYLSVMVVVPVLILTATTLRATHFSAAFHGMLTENLVIGAELYDLMLKMAPMASVWCAFVILYKFMPNTRVRVLPAVASGVVGGSLWMGWQWLYITFQVGVANYNKIYATFASVFIFLIWVYVSWQIVLLGAEIGFALQNHKTYGLEQKAHGAGIRARFALAISVLTQAAESMSLARPPFNTSAFALEKTIPVKLLNEVVERMVSAGFLARVADSRDEFVLLRAPERISAEDVFAAFVDAGADAKSLGLDKLDPAVGAALEDLERESASAMRSRTIADLLKLRS